MTPAPTIITNRGLNYWESKDRADRRIIFSVNSYLQEINAKTGVTINTFGADGRVKDINIIDPIPGATAKVIEAVQTWRFKPATENGTPVNARVPVTIILHSNG